MNRKFFLLSFGLFSLCGVSIFAGATLALENPWEAIRSPVSADGGPQVVGFYSLGCLLNAEKMEITTPHWEAVNTYRNRFYGHPQMNQFLEVLGSRMIEDHKKKIVIGDIGLPAGGPTTSGHASHQTGLDVDLRFRFYPEGKTMSDRERSNFAAPDIAFHKVERKKGRKTKQYVLKTGLVGGKLDPLVAAALQASAEDSRSERIFVSPPIKKFFCDLYAKKGDYPSWLLKLSPYFGHSDHFHVRLSCPEDSPDCVKQAPIPVDPSDKTRVGCSGSLWNWWYSTNRSEDSFFKKSVDELENPPPPSAPSWIEKVCRLPERCKQLVSTGIAHCEAPKSEVPNSLASTQR